MAAPPPRREKLPARPFEISLPAASESLGLVHATVRQLAIRDGFEPKAADEMAISVGEALANVVEHAYRGERGHDVVFRFRPGPARVRFEIEHRGRAPDAMPPEPDLQRLAAEGRRGGLGIHLMRRLMDLVAHERTPGGACQWVLERSRSRRTATLPDGAE